MKVIEGFDDEMEGLLSSMLKLDPDERISVEEALQHSFFDSIRAEHEKYE